jgi:hypothetical protein
VTSAFGFEGAEVTHCTTDYECLMNPFSTTSQTFGPIGQISQIKFWVFLTEVSAPIFAL